MAAATVGKAVSVSDPASELAFAKRLEQGDRETFEVFYEAFYPRIYGFVAKRMANRADTEEIVQEVFLNVFVSIGSYRGDAPLASWIFGVARRTIARRFRRKRHATVPLPEDESFQDSYRDKAAATPLESYEAQERLTSMNAVVENQLSREQWAVFVRHHLEDDSVATIASSLDKTEDAVKSNLYRTRKALLAS